MRQGPNPKRQRGGRPGGRKPQHGYSQNFESNGPDVKIRGNALQVLEKYQALARDAISAGDRIAAENYLQHAEHYYRIHQANSASQSGNGVGRGAPQSANGGPGAVHDQEAQSSGDAEDGEAIEASPN